jgi:ribosome recycling factor
MEKNKDIGEDESKGTQESIQKITDTYVKEVDAVIATKEKEVMTV